jgi:hypothetical protein
MQDIILYATDTMADWEYSYLTSGLAMAAEMQPGRFRFRVLADGPDTVITKGRLRLQTDGAIDDVSVDDVAMLVLPGADTWSAGHEPALALARTLLSGTRRWPPSAVPRSAWPAPACSTPARTPATHRTSSPGPATAALTGTATSGWSRTAT